MTHNSSSKIATYFDIVPVEALQNIIRHLSRAPRRSDWRHAIDRSDLITVLNSGTALSAVATDDLMSKIHNTTRQLCPITKVPEVDEEYLKVIDFAVSPFIDNLHSTWESLTEFHTTTPLPGNFPRTFAANCAQLVSLTLCEINLDFDLESLLRPISGKLQTFQVLSSWLRAPQLTAIANHCHGITKFRTWNTGFCDDTRPLWRSIGPSLRALDFGPNFRSEKSLEYIRAHCPHLHRLRFECLYQAEEIALVSDLCAALGRGLEEFVVHRGKLSREFAERLTQFSPNAALDFHFSVDDSPDLLNVPDVPRNVREISWPIVADEVTGVENLARCENITAFSVAYQHNVLRVFAALFRTPKPRLRMLKVFYALVHQQRVNLQPILKLTAAATGGLRRLDVVCEIVPPDAFESIARANRHMQDVKIVFANCGRSGNHELEIAAAGIVHAFAECAEMRTLEIVEYDRCFSSPWFHREGRSKMERLPLVDVECGRLVTRRMYVEVFGVQYLK